MTIKKSTAVIQSVAAIVMAIVLISNVQAESETNIGKIDHVSSYHYGTDSKVMNVGGLHFDLSVNDLSAMNLQQDTVVRSEGINRNTVFNENLVDVGGSHEMRHLYTW